MAAPKIEKGFSPVPHDLMEKIYSGNLTLREHKIILVVIRFTYGFNREAAELSLNFLSKAANIKYRHTQTTVSNLISKNILQINSNAAGVRSRIIQLNKNFDTWEYNIKGISPLQEKPDTTEGGMPGKGMSEKVYLEMTESVNATIDQKGIQDIKKKKINIISDSSCLLPKELTEVRGFDEAWNNWITHRKEMKKPLTTLAANLQLNKLVELRNKGSDVIELINTAIRNGWQGIFEVKSYKHGSLQDEPVRRITDHLRIPEPGEPGWL